MIKSGGQLFVTLDQVLFSPFYFSW